LLVAGVAELSKSFRGRRLCSIASHSRAPRVWLRTPVLPPAEVISMRVPSAASSSTASGLAAHTSENWEGVRVSVRGRVSIGALRQ
jgi:hypothetical protein